MIFVSLSLNLRAQTLDEAQKFYQEKNYVAAGDMYYLLYRFEESIDAYQKQEQLLIKNKKAEEVDFLKPLIQRSERAARMLAKCEDIQIIDSVIIDKQQFLEAYRIGRETGSLAHSDNGVVYENPLKDKRYFAKTNSQELLRLYQTLRIQDQWVDESELPLPYDSLENAAYPFLLPDGMTLYYASTGNESIGGYDLFMTRYNSNNDSYLTPAQMGMPFNSPYNDYLMVIDEDNNTGYFATDRYQSGDRVVVYTFIPNEEIQPIEIEDEQTRIDRAKITSIRDSWKEKTDYAAYIADVRKNILAEQMQAKRAFVFVIDDNRIYYTMDDFQQDAALQAFLKARELEKQIQTIENELNTLRQDYAVGSPNVKQSIQSTIIYREKRIPELWEQYKQRAKEARNLEIKK
jgi:hypothetical protein